MCASRQLEKLLFIWGKNGEWIKEGETAWKLYRDVHTEFPSVEGNDFCKDREGFRLSCVTSSTASLSSTIKCSLRCQ